MEISAEHILERISEDLGLLCGLQDWGIINADGSRWHEFMSFFEQNGEFTEVVGYELAELVIASFNEAMRSQSVESAHIETFKRFIEERVNANEAPAAHWRLLDPKDFPVSALLRNTSKRTPRASLAPVQIEFSDIELPILFR